MASKARDALEFAFEFLAGIEMETDAQNLDRENVLCAIQDALDEPDDPIVSAVRAELQPLEDALIDAGHKLAKDGNHAWLSDATGTACAVCGGTPIEHGEGGEVIVACECGNRDTITLPLTAMPPCSADCGRRMRIVGIYNGARA
jgi:hypothetical protein